MVETGAVVGCSDPWNGMGAGTHRVKTDHGGGLGERLQSVRGMGYKLQRADAPSDVAA